MLETKNEIVRYLLIIIVLLAAAGIISFFVLPTSTKEGMPNSITGIISEIGGDGTQISIKTSRNGWGKGKVVVGNITSETGIFRETGAKQESVTNVTRVPSTVASIPFTELKVGDAVLALPVRESIEANPHEFDLLVLTVQPQ